VKSAREEDYETRSRQCCGKGALLGLKRIGALGIFATSSGLSFFEHVVFYNQDDLILNMQAGRREDDHLLEQC
jgi:hypothetical protein